MFCAKCGTEIPEDYVFCSKCGSPAPERPPDRGPEEPRTTKGGGSRLRTILLVLSLVFVTWLGSAGIAYGVVELTGGGPQGEQGEQGPRGERGPAGAAGASGSDFGSIGRDARIANALTVISLVSNYGGFQSSDSPAGEACFDWLMFGEGSATECGFTR
jgi:hypothetical protein